MSVTGPTGSDRPASYLMTVVARDPSVRTGSGGNRQILRTRIKVPATRLEEGPRGPRFHVVTFDATDRQLRPPVALAGRTGRNAGWAYRDRFLTATDSQLISDHRFHAQNVYAIAARTLALFEAALGRPVPWAFGRAQLYLVPTAFVEPNAFYADDIGALLFGYFDTGRPKATKTLTCLAHDIVAHETTHAILDGLRRRFDVPGLPDQAGFHEGLADVVALLSILSAPEAISSLIGRPGRVRVDRRALSVDELRGSVLFQIGLELGQALTERRSGLRNSATLEPTEAWKNLDDPVWAEPHRRGEVLAAAVLQTFLHMWTARLEPIVSSGTVDLRRASEEGSRAAAHLLSMVIRAIDYCPPVDFELTDFLAAISTAYREVDPDDELGYLSALSTGFGAFGITEKGAGDAWKAPVGRAPSYRHFSYAALRADPNETFRFLWDHSDYLGLDTGYQLRVENVRPANRQGPRGFVVSETVLDYVQELVLTRAELARLIGQRAPGLSSELPSLALVPAESRLKIWGGGTIIFDEFGAVKHHRQKRLDDWPRQLRRLTYLARRGQWDSRGQLGFSSGAPLGQRFAQFHEPLGQPEESW